MMLPRTIISLFSGLALFTGIAPAREFRITPETDLKPLLKEAGPGDSIVLADGSWTDVRLRFEGLEGSEDKPIRIRAETAGKVVFSGKVRFELAGEHVVVSGLSFLNPTGISDVFSFRSSSDQYAHRCRITDCSFEQTQSGTDEKSRWLSIYGSGNRVDHCYFAGKRNLGPTLVVWVDETPGSHRIDRNHFGPRPELGQNGGETIRVGTSHVSEFDERTVVEENYFERCDGESEIISNKSCENLYRFNLFERCSGALTLRHGHRCRVDANVFLGHEAKGTGGIRVIGEDHRVTNNYLEALRGDDERAAISIMSGIPDGPLNGYAPVRNAFIAHNTLIDCKVSMDVGLAFSDKLSVVPADCRISHNLFVPGKWPLFEISHKPRNFRWEGNRLQSGKVRGERFVEMDQVDLKLVRRVDGILTPTNSEILQTGLKTELATDIDGGVRRPGIAGCDDPENQVAVRKLRELAGPAWRK